MKEVTVFIEHPGKLEIVAEILADSPAYAAGLKQLHQELEGSKLDASLSFDEAQGKLTCTVNVESAAHKAKLAAEQKAVDARLDKIRAGVRALTSPAKKPAKTKAKKKK